MNKWEEGTNLAEKPQIVYVDTPFREVKLNSPPSECGLDLVTCFQNIEYGKKKRVRSRKSS